MVTSNVPFFQMINDETTTRTIYVGNILTISDDELRDYFANLAPIETIYHDSTGTGDLWLVDYRFIRFSPGSDLNIFFNSKFDHLIGRIRLDIHPFDAVFSEKTRLISDRKICIAHTNPSLNRNLIKKVRDKKPFRWLSLFLGSFLVFFLTVRRLSRSTAK